MVGVGLLFLGTILLGFEATLALRSIHAEMDFLWMLGKHHAPQPLRDRIPSRAGVARALPVKPTELLGETRAPDGTHIALTRQDREFIILAGGRPLMSSRMHGSEQALATFGCRHLTGEAPRVLVGGMGMGFTLRATLDALPAGATVIVAELIPAVIEWNRGPLGPLADHPLRDARVGIALGDVGATIRTSVAAFDAILLDVDNGPDAFTASGNAVAVRRSRSRRHAPRLTARWRPRGVVGLGRQEVRTAPEVRRLQRARRARAGASEGRRAAPHDLCGDRGRPEVASARLSEG